ncbi:MAG: hypothetical protein O3A84_13620, partial [Proteobacteria bacterium]|nr:hypothetical protein [Pseudomonadota bacterium]
MKRSTKILIGLGTAAALTTTAFVGTGVTSEKVTQAVLNGDTPVAEKAHFRGGEGKHQRAGYHGRRGHGGPGFRGQRGAGLIEQFDADKDGKLTQAELDQSRAAQHAKFDANKDGKLSLKEYEALWLDAMRTRMVRNFQRHDTDGDAAVTVEEFGARFAKMIERLDRNNDGALSKEDRRQRSEGRRGGRHGGEDGQRGPRGPR